MLPAPGSAQRPSHSAIFVDIENIYYYLKNCHVGAPDTVVYEIIRQTRSWLREQRGEPTLVMLGYADFDQVDISLGDLYLMGVEPRTVVSTGHKNAADMRLCIDALEILYTRPDICTFTLVGGDRDYIPLVQHLQKQGRTVLVVAFRGNVSGDLLSLVGENCFVDAAQFLDERLARQIQSASITATTMKATSAISSPTSFQARTTFNPAVPIEDVETRRCLEILVNEYGAYYPEVWLTPFSRRLNEAFPLLANHERRMLIANLEMAGAIRVERREGNPYPYSVAIINWDHPTVQEVNDPQAYSGIREE